MKRVTWSMLLALLAMTAGIARAEVATAYLEDVRTGTAENLKIKGDITLTDTAQGLRVSGNLTNVPAGKHGFHIHEFGSCANQGNGAGSHYNPGGTPHGDVVKAGPEHVHAGDMGNITADAKGFANLEVLIPNVMLAGGKYSVGGRAIVLHEKADDFGQPTGNAGSRIACGPILLNKEGATASANKSGEISTH